MARKKTRLQEEIEEILEAVGEVDPRLAPLATLREQLPAEPRCPAGDSGDSTPAPGPIAQSLELEEALRRLQEEARRRRQEAEARKAEADAIRQRLEELAQERQRLQGIARRAQALVAWAPAQEVQALAQQAQARIEAMEAEMRDLAARLQELEVDEGVRRLREEEAVRQAQEEAARKAEEARALLRQGKVAEAIRHSRRAIRQAGGEAPTSLAQALEEALRIARRLAGGAFFQAREALTAGDPARAMREVRVVADLLPYLPPEERRPLHGVFCRAAAVLAQGQPLVLLRGRRRQRGWTAPPGTIAVATPVQGGARVLYNLGTPWKEGATVPEGVADVQPLRAAQPSSSRQ
jgi:tetratricopeptide (TPR) repeat protein